MMDNDQSAMEPLTSRSYSTKSPVIVTQQQSSYSQHLANNSQPNSGIAQHQPPYGQHLTNNLQSNYVPQPPPLVLGPTNLKATCPHCKASIKTAIEYTVTNRTHRTAIGCCVCCCCCLPYCMNSARNTDHYCPNCKFYLGTYER